MIQIPPIFTDIPSPKRPDGIAVQGVPAVLADQPALNPGVVLDLPAPVMETPTDGMRARGPLAQPDDTQIDTALAAKLPGQAAPAEPAMEVRSGLVAAGLPERLANLLKQLQQLSAKDSAPVLWPADADVQAGRPEAGLMNLRRALGESMMFELPRLQARLLPATARSPDAPDASVQADGADAQPQMADLAQAAKPVPKWTAEDPAIKQTDVTARDAEEGAQTDSKRSAQTAPQGSEPITGESPPIRDALRLLLFGELRWQGTLSPGVFARLNREDVWQEDPDSPGALVKGTVVSVDMTLPTLGSVRVRGMFIKDSVRVTILPEQGARGSLTQAFTSLEDRLSAMGLDRAHVRMSEE